MQICLITYQKWWTLNIHAMARVMASDMSPFLTNLQSYLKKQAVFKAQAISKQAYTILSDYSEKSGSL